MISNLLYCAVLLVCSMVSVAAQVLKVPPPPTTLAQYVIQFDWSSLGFAALLALTGGAFRTGISLQSESREIASAFRETVKDALLALVTGVLGFLLLAGIGAVWWPVPFPAQVCFLGFAGFTRGKFVAWLDVAFGKALDLGFDVAEGWVRKRAGLPTGEKP